MRIDFILLCASLVVADNFEYKYLPSLMGKLDGERSVNPSNYRFMASLRRDDVHICSATLLSNEQALTAATCLKGFLNETMIPSFDTFSLVAGRFDIDNGTTVFEIKQVQVHDSFRFYSPRIVHNIGLVTMMKNNVEESEYLGWGVRKEKRPIMGETADLLVWTNINESPGVRKKTFRIIEQVFCNFYKHSPIICAIDTEKDQILSEENLGAPLIQNNVVIGILAQVQEKLQKSVLFIDLYKSRKEIDKLIDTHVGMYRIHPPRKKARYDCNPKPKKRARKDTIEETDNQEKK